MENTIEILQAELGTAIFASLQMIITAMIISFFIGGILGLLQTKLYMFGGSGLFSFPNFVNPVSGQITDLVKYAVSVLIAGVFTFIVQLIIYKDKDAEILNK